MLAMQHWHSNKEDMCALWRVSLGDDPGRPASVDRGQVSLQPGQLRGTDDHVGIVAIGVLVLCSDTPRPWALVGCYLDIVCTWT